MSLNGVTKLTFIICIQIFMVAGSINENIIDTGCHDDADCKVFVEMNTNEIANATCFNRHCICKDSNFKTVQCLPQKLGLSNVIGGKCPCSTIKWSTCANGFCMCRADFVPSVDKRNCLPEIVPIGSTCENDVQCSKGNAFAACTNQTCTCKSDFILFNGTCHSLVVRGKECESDTKCIKPHMICNTKQCFCETGYVAKFDKMACLPNVDYKDGCLESAQCQHKLGLGAVCELGKCICGEDFSTISFNVTANHTKTTCERRVAIGQMCAYDTDCFQSRFNGTDQSMYCHLKECKCAQDYELDRDQRFCVKSKDTELQSTWLDSFYSKVLSSFASSAGNSNKCLHLHYLMATFCVVSIILLV